MNKAIAATIAIWALGLSAASALIYTLTRPLEPVQAVQPDVASASSSEKSSPQDTIETRNVITMPPIELTGHPRPPSSPHAARAPLARRWRDLSEMRCSDWKPLAMGPADQGVRYCE